MSGAITEEMAVLSSIVIDPQAIVIVSPVLSGRHFIDQQLGKLYDVLLMLHESGRKINDPLVLKRELPKCGVDAKLCEVSFLVQLINATPHAAHARYYAEQIRRLSDLRQLQGIAHGLARRTEKPDVEPAELAELTAMELGALGINAPVQALDFGEIARQAVRQLRIDLESGKRGGVFSGLESLDSSIGPLMRGELGIIAARPSEGKTVLGLQASLYNAQKGRPSLFVSLEMKDRELAFRYLCKAAGVDSVDLRKGAATLKELDALQDASEQIHFPLRVYAPHKATFAEIKAAVRHAKIVHGSEMVCIDYLGRITPARDERHLKRHEVTSDWIIGSKTLAKELDMPTWLIVQLNREGAKDIPQLHHLAESGDIEREADMVLMIHHPPMSDQEKRDPPEIREAHIIVAKQRHGMKGIVKVGWRPKSTEFMEMPVTAMSNYNSDFAAHGANYQ